MQIDSLKWTLPIVMAASTLLMSAGCGVQPGAGKPRGSVSITILYDGDPVTKGLVNLDNLKTGEGGGGELNGQGKVIVPYVVLGEYTVVVLPPDLEPPKPEDSDKPISVPKYNNLPQRFRNAKTSPLIVQVKNEDTEYTFDLKKEDHKPTD